jgi:hypothetical protein
MYTPLGWCEEWRLTLLDFIAQTRSKYLKQRASGILTLLEIWWLGCGLFCCFKVYRKCTLLSRERGVQSIYIAGYGLNIQVACALSMDDDI